MGMGFSILSSILRMKFHIEVGTREGRKEKNYEKSTNFY